MTASRITVREDAKGRPECPKCKAPAGEPCVKPSGRIAEMVHKDRAEAQTPAERRRHKFYENQALRPVGKLAVVGGTSSNPHRTAKGLARRERKAALRRKRGFGR